MAYQNKRSLFKLIFQLRIVRKKGRVPSFKIEDREPAKGAGWNQPYLRALKTLSDSLHSADFSYIAGQLETLFMERVHAVPNINSTRWIATGGESKERICWIFWGDRNPWWRADGIHHGLDGTSAKIEEPTMHGALGWNVTLEDALGAYEGELRFVANVARQTVRAVR